MEEERKCQERYEEEMRKLEEERKGEQELQESHEVTPQQTLCEEITCETRKIGGEAVEALVENVLDNVPHPQEQEAEKTRKGGYAQTLEEEDGKLETTALVETMVDTDLRIFGEEHFSDMPQRDTPPPHSNESRKRNGSSSPQDVLVECENCGDKITKDTGAEGQRMSSANGPLETEEDDLHHINNELNSKCDMDLLTDASETKCPVNSSEEALHALTHNGEVEGDEQVGKADVAVSPSHLNHQKPREGFGESELHSNEAKGHEEHEEVQRADVGEPGLETLQLPEPYKGRLGAGSRLMVEVCRLDRPISVKYLRKKFRIQV